MLIADAQSAPGSLTLTATSSDQALVPNASIVLGGSGANRTVKVTPSVNRVGNANIMLMVSDGVASASDTFTLAVQLSAGGSWRQQHFGSMANSGAAADGADPDADGLSNLWERAFALDPHLPQLNPWPVANRADGYLALRYRRSLAATDLTYQVLWSSDLATWSESDVSDTRISGDAAAETREGKVSILDSTTPLFLHLRITAP